MISTSKSIGNVKVMEVVANQNIRSSREFFSRDSFYENSVDDMSSTFLTSYDNASRASYSKSQNILPAIQSYGSNLNTSKSAGTASIFSKDEKYFGKVARDMFFERYQWLARQRRIIHTSSKETSRSLLFDNEVFVDHPCSSRQSRRPPSPPGIGDDYTINTWDSVDADDEAFEHEVNNLTAETIIASEELTSPRTTYIASCIRDGLNPRANLIVRKNNNTEYNLAHQGIGDQMIKLLAQSLDGIPQIESIDLNDNNLTDEGMTPILTSIELLPNVVELNLSKNVIGPKTAAALARYLSLPICNLKKLIIEDADVDDFECVLFVNAIIEQNKVIELDLSRNKIGDAENLNTVMPDVITGSEALANLLRTSDCSLETLKLSWNTIRLDGAVDFARSLSLNSSLTHLDLSFNALGHDGGEALGDAILDNRTLRTLLLSTNSIDSTACFTICVGVLENLALRHVCLDGNPIGERGAQALMLVPVVAGNRVSITANNCNISLRDVRCFFDPGEPCGTYSLQLERPFERAIAFKILEIVASHSTYVIRKISYEPPATVPPGGSNSKKKKPKLVKPTPLELVQSVSYDKEKYQDEAHKVLSNKLTSIINACTDSDLAASIFEEFDLDGSGGLDKDELSDLMAYMGLDTDTDRLGDLMSMIDVDDSGYIGLPEFLSFLKSQQRDAVARLKDLTELPMMALAESPNDRYIPPRSGVLYIEVADGFTVKEDHHVISSVDQANVILAAGSGENVSRLMLYAVQNSKLRHKEALFLYNSLVQDTGDPFRALNQLLPRMTNSNDARALVSRVVGEDTMQMGILKQSTGLALRPLFGVPNGYYKLDLSKEMDRVCLLRLLEISKTTNCKRMLRNEREGCGSVGDTSQKGNNSCFRNEIVNGVPMAIDPSLFTPMPKSGKLEFDFSGGDRPYDVDDADTPTYNNSSNSNSSSNSDNSFIALSDARCVKFMNKIGLIKKEQKETVYSELAALKAEVLPTLSGEGNTIYEPDLPRADAIGEARAQFYDKLKMRSQLTAQASALEVLTIDVSRTKSETLLNNNGKNPLFPYNTLDSRNSDNSPLTGNSMTSALKNALGNRSRSRMSDFRIDWKAEGRVSKPPLKIETESDIILPCASNVSVPGIGYDDLCCPPSGVHTPTNNNSMNGSSSVLSYMSGTPLSHTYSVGLGFEHPPLTPLANKALKRSLSKSNDMMMRVFGKTKVALKHKTAHSRNVGVYISELLESKRASVKAKAMHVVEAVADCLGRLWIYARHVATIIQYFPQGKELRTQYFGSYNVELVVLLFGRIIDIHNFELVLRVLTPQEVACVTCRIGWLNIFNPLKPEGGYQLDLSHWDERQVTKILMALKVVEPGAPWKEEWFRLERKSDYVASWLMPQAWLTEDGMPRKGVVNVFFFSGGGTGRLGCKPNFLFRKSLLDLVLISEKDITNEYDSNNAVTLPEILPSASRLALETDINNLWSRLLVPVVSASKAGGGAGGGDAKSRRTSAVLTTGRPKTSSSVKSKSSRK